MGSHTETPLSEAFKNFEEFRTVTEVENVIAEALGESTRANDWGVPVYGSYQWIPFTWRELRQLPGRLAQQEKQRGKRREELMSHAE
jgi:hypothetical protein